MSKGIFWNGEEKILVKDGKPICQVERIHNQWLLEYNPVSPSAFATSSKSPVLEPPTQESLAAESNEATTERSTEPESKKPIRERPVRKSVQTPLSKANFMTWHREWHISIGKQFLTSQTQQLVYKWKEKERKQQSANHVS